MADQPPGGLTGRDADLHPTGPSSRFKSLLPLLLAVAGVIAWSVSLSSIHPYAAPASGLVSQLSVLWWLGVALAAAGIVLELSRESPRTIIMIPTLIALALILHGTLPATEPVPRFAAAGMMAKAIGVSTTWFLRWCPLGLNLVDMIPLKVIADTCLRTSRAR